MIQRVIRKRGLMVRVGITWIGVTALLAVNAVSLAQTVTQSQDSNQKQVFLVRKDTAECSGSDVPNVDSPLVGGNVVVTRLRDETTRAEVAMTAKPNSPAGRHHDRRRRRGNCQLYVSDEFRGECICFRDASGGRAAGKSVPERAGRVLAAGEGDIPLRSGCASRRRHVQVGGHHA
jgi:hypothetical protein